jgi:hypothetical protein
MKAPIVCLLVLAAVLLSACVEQHAVQWRIAGVRQNADCLKASATEVAEILRRHGFREQRSPPRGDEAAPSEDQSKLPKNFERMLEHYITAELSGSDSCDLLLSVSQHGSKKLTALASQSLADLDRELTAKFGSSRVKRDY